MSTLRIVEFDVGPSEVVVAGEGESLTHALNRVAGTVGLEAQGAAQVWASAPGVELVGCLNKKNGTTGIDLLGVVNALAGTTDLAIEGAAALLHN